MPMTSTEYARGRNPQSWPAVGVVALFFDASTGVFKFIDSSGVLRPVGADWLEHVGLMEKTRQHAVFSGAGALALDDNVGGWWWNRSARALELVDVTMWREKTGTSGSLVGDVQLGTPIGGGGVSWASVYATPDRPTIATGTDYSTTQANTFATTTIPVGGALRFRIVQVEGGSSQNVVTQITLK